MAHGLHRFGKPRGSARDAKGGQVQQQARAQAGAGVHGRRSDPTELVIAHQRHHVPHQHLQGPGHLQRLRKGLSPRPGPDAQMVAVEGQDSPTRILQGEPGARILRIQQVAGQAHGLHQVGQLLRGFVGQRRERGVQTSQGVQHALAETSAFLGTDGAPERNSGQVPGQSRTRTEHGILPDAVHPFGNVHGWSSRSRSRNRPASV